MTINAVSSSSSTTSTSTLGLQDFLNILMTQLQYQDPLKPMDNEQFMAQMAQFTTLQQTQQLNDQIGQLISNQAALQSVGLIGRTVDITTSNGTATGTVSALSLQGSSPQITLTTTDGSVLSSVDLSQIVAVR